MNATSLRHVGCCMRVGVCSLRREIDRSQNDRAQQNPPQNKGEESGPLQPSHHYVNGQQGARKGEHEDRRSLPHHLLCRQTLCRRKNVSAFQHHRSQNGGQGKQKAEFRCLPAFESEQTSGGDHHTAAAGSGNERQSLRASDDQSRSKLDVLHRIRMFPVAIGKPQKNRENAAEPCDVFEGIEIIGNPAVS